VILDMDEDYCQFCGHEDDTVHKETGLGVVCNTCCGGIALQHFEYCEEFPDDPLDVAEWVKLTYEERIIKVDWSEEEVRTYTHLASLIGLTLEQFVVRCIKLHLDENYPA
jgi:hypothetical protein